MRLSVAVPLIGLLSMQGMAAARAQHAAPASPEADLRVGIELFNRADFAEALAHFLRAQRAGVDAPALHYDLGATYYRLRRYSLAAEQFRRLLHDPQFGDFARYNLGLIARGRGQEAQARHFFSAVAGSARSPGLRALARARLAQGTAALAPARRARSWHGFVDGGSGFDDNVALLPRYSPLSTAGGGAPYLRLYTDATGRLTGDSRHGLWANGSLYEVHYTRQSAFDLLIGRLGPEYRFAAGSWQIGTGLYGTYIGLGSRRLESSGSLSVSASHRWGSATLRLDETLEKISGGSAYRYLSGYQNQLTLRATWRIQKFELELTPGVTVSRRQDLTAGSEFFSVSATRLQLDAYALWNVAARISLYARGSFWHSRYRNPNVYFDQGLPVTRRRIDDTLEGELGLMYRLAPSWHVSIEYGLRRNDSTIGSYGYSSNRYSLRLRYSY